MPKQFLRKFLTTASSLAIITTSATNAFAVPAVHVFETTGNVTLSNPAQNTQVSGTADGAPDAGDPADVVAGGDAFRSGTSLDIRDADTTIAADAADFNLRALLLRAQPGIMTVTQNTMLGSVANTDNVTRLKIAFAAGGNASPTLVLSGNDSAPFADGANVGEDTYDLDSIDFRGQAGAISVNFQLEGGGWNIVDTGNGNGYNTEVVFSTDSKFLGKIGGAVLDDQGNVVAAGVPISVIKIKDDTVLLNQIINAGLIEIGVAAVAPAGGNLGTPAVDATLTRGGVVDFSVGGNIQFLTANSTLELQNILPTPGAANASNKTVTLTANLTPANDSKGIIKLKASNAAVGLTVNPTNLLANETIGANNNRMLALLLEGNGNIAVNVPVFAKKIGINNGGITEFTKAVDAGGDGEIFVIKDATFAHETLTASAILIGDIDNNTPAILTRGGEVDFSVGDNIKFLTADSVLKLQNTLAAPAAGGNANANDRTVTLAATLAPNMPNPLYAQYLIDFAAHNADPLANPAPAVVQPFIVAGNNGVVELHSTTAGVALTVDGAANEKIGIDAATRMQGLVLDGDGNITVNVPVFAKAIVINNGGITEFTRAVDTGADGEILVAKDATFSHETLNANVIQIGTGDVAPAGGNPGTPAIARTLTRGGEVDFSVGNNIGFASADSVLKLQNTLGAPAAGGNANDRTVTLAATLAPNIVNPAYQAYIDAVRAHQADPVNNPVPGPAVAPFIVADNNGIVELHSTTAGVALTVDDNGVGGGEKIGIDAATRMRKLELTGAGDIGVNVPVFAKAIVINNGGITEFTRAVDTGADGEIFVIKDATFSDATLAANIIQIGTGDVAGVAGTPATLTRGGAVDFSVGGNVRFGVADSVLKLQNTLGAPDVLGGAAPNANDKIVTLEANLAPSIPNPAYDPNDRNPAPRYIDVNDHGIVELHSATADVALIVNDNGGGETIGIDNAHRISKLDLTGAGDTLVNVPVFAKEIAVASAIAIFAVDIDSGMNSSLTIAAGKAADLPLNATITNITFTGAGGTLTARNINGAVDSTAGAGGTLILKGGTVRDAIGAANELTEVQFDAGGNAIILGGAAKATTFKFITVGQVTANGLLTGDIDFNGLAGRLTAGAIDGAVNNTIAAGGTLILTGGRVRDAIGTAANPLTAVHFNAAGGNAINLDDDAFATTFKFLAAGQVTALGLLKGDVDFNGQAGILNVWGDIDGSVDGNAAVVGGASAGTLNFSLGNTVSGAIGANTAINIINVKGAAATTLTNAVVKATTINIGEANAAGDATLARKVNANFDINSGTGINFLNPDSVLLLENTNAGGDITATLFQNLTGGADDVGKVKLASANGGILNIANNAGVGGGAFTIGAAGQRRRSVETQGNVRVEPVVFTKNLTLNGGIHNFVSGVVLGDAGSIDVESNSTLQGNVTGNDSTINLADKTLTYNQGQATFEGNLAINVTLLAGGDVGHVLIVNPGVFDLSNVTNLTITLNGDSTGAHNGETYSILRAANAGDIVVDPAAAIPFVFNNNDNTGAAWTFDVTNFTITQTPAVVPPVVVPPVVVPPVVHTQDEVDLLNRDKNNGYFDYELDGNNIIKVADLPTSLEEDFGTTNPELVSAFSGVDINDGSDAADIVLNLGELNATPARQQEAGDRLKVIVATEAIEQVTSEVSRNAQNAISSRINNVSTAIQVTQGFGAAAGDELTTAHYGVWGSPLYGQATQKQKGSSAGYKSKSFGGTVGFDALVNENLTLGAAVTFVNTKLNHKDKKAGDKTKVGSALFSIYGAQQLNDNFFVQGIVSVGTNDIRNKEKRVTGLLTSQTATAKYKSTTYTGEVLGGYKYALPNTSATLTPMVGLKYAKFVDNSYTETGTTNRNYTVNKKTVNRFEGVLGARITNLSEMNGAMLALEGHGFVDYNFTNKASKGEATLSGLAKPMVSKSAKPSRTAFNLGASASLKHNMMEYGVGYDAYLASKYVGHQGSLKVRVNF